MISDGPGRDAPASGPVAAVLFDFFGTLIRPEPGAPRYEHVFAACGYDVDGAVLTEFYDHPDHVEHRDHSASEQHYDAWTRVRLEDLCRRCGVIEADLARVAAALRAASAYGVEPYPEAADVLAVLRSRGVAVAVCSNWGWHLDPPLAAAGLGGLVDAAVTSARVGVRKPHPDIYHHTLERLGVAPERAVFVGDTWLPDVEGPLRAGLRAAIHVDRRDGWASVRHDVDGAADLPVGVHRVPDLRAVPDLLA